VKAVEWLEADKQNRQRYIKMYFLGNKVTGVGNSGDVFVAKKGQRLIEGIGRSLYKGSRRLIRS